MNTILQALQSIAFVLNFQTARLQTDDAAQESSGILHDLLNSFQAYLDKGVEYAPEIF
jgi:hypothetical protein